MKNLSITVIMRKAFVFPLILMLAFATCTKKQPTNTALEIKELRFMWWGSEERNNATLQTIALFEERNPEVKIYGEYSAYDGYFDKLAAQLAGGTAPDIIQNEPNRLASQLTHLTDLTSKIDFSGYTQDSLKQMEINGRLYGAPLQVAGGGLAYNKTQLDRYGIEPLAFPFSWEDLGATVKEIYTKSGGKLYGIADQGVWGPNAQIAPFIAAKKPDLVGQFYPYDNDKLTLVEEDLEFWYQYWAELRDFGALVPPEVTIAGESAANNVVAKGISAYIIIPATIFGQLVGQTTDELGLLPLPVSSQMTGSTMTYGQPTSIYNKSKHLETAVSFLNFLVNDPDAAKLLRATRGVLPTKVQRDAFATLSSVSNADRAIIDCLNKYSEYDIRGPVAGLGFKAAGQIFNTLQLFDQVGQEIAFKKLAVDKAPAEFLTRANKMADTFK
ncbi:MAG: extracellular solute-binding protein [Treponema sp.]|jgi:multiple sugar transport system substrate-binding protein|nr:extracellular solute-binding protein [Treponema sp.]